MPRGISNNGTRKPREYKNPSKYNMVNDLHWSEGRYSPHTTEEQKIVRAWYNLHQDAAVKGRTVDNKFSTLSFFRDYIQALEGYDSWLVSPVRVIYFGYEMEGDTITGLYFKYNKRKYKSFEEAIERTTAIFV